MSMRPAFSVYWFSSLILFLSLCFFFLYFFYWVPHFFLILVILVVSICEVDVYYSWIFIYICHYLLIFRSYWQCCFDFYRFFWLVTCSLKYMRVLVLFRFDSLAIASDEEGNRWAVGHNGSSDIVCQLEGIFYRSLTAVMRDNTDN